MLGQCHTAEGADADTAFLLGKDTNTFRDIVDGLLSGSDVLKLPAEKNPETRAKLIELQTEFNQYQQSVTGILANIESFIAAKQAEQLLFKDNEALKQRIGGLLDTFRAARDDWGLSFWMLLSSALVALLAAIGAWLGWQMLPLVIMLSSIVGAVVGTTLIVAARLGRKILVVTSCL